MSLGFGFGTAVQSIVTSIVRKDQVGRLYSAISAAETAGTLVAQPLLALGLAAGFRLGGLAVGLPWFMCVVSGPLCARTCLLASLTVYPIFRCFMPLLHFPFGV